MLGGKGKTKKRRMTIHVNQIQRTTAAVSVWAAPALLMNFINEAPRRAIISWLEYLKESLFCQWCTEKESHKWQKPPRAARGLDQKNKSN